MYKNRLISSAEFNALLAQGRRLAILEDMVLDLEGYENLHPGGTFLIEHNIGKDVSKYFYGGYSLEPSKVVHGHAHSQNARRIVNDLAIGVYVNHS